jgi:hypothetical protein
MWNGTAETLKTRPARMKTRPITAPSAGGPAAKTLAMDTKLVVPAKPYTSDEP